MEARVAAFVSRRWSVPEALLRVEIEPLPGGLESTVVLARLKGPSRIPACVVVKELRHGLAREAEIYEWLWGTLERPPAVRLLGRERIGPATYLYLENAESFSAWPWSDTAAAAAVCRELARFHDSAAQAGGTFSWDYETDLVRSAETTLELAGTVRDTHGGPAWPRLGDLRRVVAMLPSIRSHLLKGGLGMIHGDMHPGNAFVRTVEPQSQVILVDWARARVGSALEDVASWLHSLGCWEPEARRRHDTLLRAYLDSRRVSRPLGFNLRREYWFASASNGLAGAIRHHLVVLANPLSTGSARLHSSLALPAWERVIKRTAELVRSSRAAV